MVQDSLEAIAKLVGHTSGSIVQSVADVLSNIKRLKREVVELQGQLEVEKAKKAPAPPVVPVLAGDRTNDQLVDEILRMRRAAKGLLSTLPGDAPGVTELVASMGKPPTL